MNKVEFTHHGWFGICPVIFAEIDSDAPYIEPRYRCLEWLFNISEFMQDTVVNMRCLMDVSYEPSFVLKITGELKNPIVLEF